MKNCGKKIMALVMTVILLISSAGFLPALAEKKSAKASEIRITGPKYIAKGKSVTLEAEVLPAGSSQKVKWESSNKKIATVSSSGKVQGKKAGKVKITATSKENKKVKAVWKVEITSDPVKSIKITAKTTDLYLNGASSVTLKAKASPSSASQEFTWKSSDKKVAKVSGKGKVTAVGTGTAKITATAMDGSKKKGSITITVRKKAAPAAPADPDGNRPTPPDTSDDGDDTTPPDASDDGDDDGAEEPGPAEPDIGLEISVERTVAKAGSNEGFWPEVTFSGDARSLKFELVNGSGQSVGFIRACFWNTGAMNEENSFTYTDAASLSSGRLSLGMYVPASTPAGLYTIRVTLKTGKGSRTAETPVTVTTGYGGTWTSYKVPGLNCTIQLSPGQYWTSNKYSSGSSKSCDGCIECWGFARYVQNAKYGQRGTKTSYGIKPVWDANGNLCTASSGNQQKIWNAFMNAGVGAHVRVYDASKSRQDNAYHGHSFIITAISDSSMSIIQCNGTATGNYSDYGYCKVSTATWSRSKYFSSVIYGKRGLMWIEAVEEPSFFSVRHGADTVLADGSSSGSVACSPKAGRGDYLTLTVTSSSAWTVKASDTSWMTLTTSGDNAIVTLGSVQEGHSYSSTLTFTSDNRNYTVLVTLDKPSAEPEFSARFTRSTKTLNLGESWIVEAKVSVSGGSGCLGAVTINSADLAGSTLTDNFRDHQVSEVETKYWAAYRIDTTKAPWNQPGTYTLRIWAKDTNGTGGTAYLATMKLTIR